MDLLLHCALSTARLVSLCCLAAFVVVFRSSDVSSMEFTLVREPGIELEGVIFPDIVAIHASGDIEEGDARKFAAVMPDAARDQYGNVRIYLDSRGGSVAEAKAMVSVMDEYEVTAVVDGRSECLSACASVLFLSARIHFMLEGAQIGFHTCKVASVIASPVCNEILSGDLVYRGTDFGATSSFLKVGTDKPDDMIYMDWRAATMWGLIGPPTYDPTLARPSFKCDDAQTALMQQTCADMRLARYESSFARSFFFLAETRKQGLGSAQNSYAKELKRIESLCGAAADCLLNEYAKSREAVRLSILAGRLALILPHIERPEVRTDIEARFGRCRDASECGRPDLLDGTFEFSQANFAILFATLILAHQNGENAETGYSDQLTGTSDCAIRELCDPAIRTFNWSLFTSTVEKKIPVEQLMRRIEELRASLPLQEIQYR